MNQINLASTWFPVVWLVFFSFFFQARKGLAVDENFTICGVPRYCGGLWIKFPFFIQELDEPRCGFPRFNVSCRNNSAPVLSLPDGDYNIRNIFYQNQSFLVSRADRDAVCSHSIQNISLPDDRFYLPKSQREMVLLFDCNLTTRGMEEFSQDMVDCGSGNRSNTTLALWNGDKDLGFVSGNCTKSVLAPVAFTDGMENVEDVVNRGPHSARCRPERNKLWLRLGLGIGISILIVLLISIYVVWGRYRRKYASPICFRGKASPDRSSRSDLESNSSVCFELPIFSYGELVEATDNFDDEKELGDGGFGTVYYGKLRDGREVAIKRLYQHNYRRLEQFKNEVEILTRLRHKNLVSLYGCTSRRSQELLLVYEYIRNGTVADHLHGDLVQSGWLTWPIRMNIAIETASALAYLHASDTIHRDVKTNNILLDDNFSVKVADFGLSRFFPTDVTHISTAPQGTPGYVDPEYHQCYQLTGKSDVYSFGVVLIELISSMPAVDISRHRSEINLANLAINKIQKCAFDELIDPNLGYNSDAEVTRMTTAVAELAFRCLQHEKEMRPSMEEVLEELQRIQSEGPRLSSVQEEHIDSDVTGSVPPPPSPPIGDKISLLKNIRLPSSPVSVTDKWISRDTTPNASG
ncbi:hypothetical protein V6N12_030336 [Hibiscus sabdariffa]|uniref:Protein kinase domain-containing protein n=1 Tax=Hibiscus sabdariffa TaxID=183260 RepID=A0ABR2C0N5_9ROSI